MAQGKAIEYYLTEKGLGFNQSDPKYIAEEKEIIDILKDGRLSVNKILELVNKSLNRERGWGFMIERLDLLEKEGFLLKYGKAKE